MKFGKKSIGAITAGLSLVMALSPVAALADGVTTTPSVVVKTLEGNEGSSVTETFQFPVAQVTAADGVTVDGEAVSTDGPAANAVSIELTKGDDKTTVSSPDNQNALSFTGDFTHAGTYAYTVTEAEHADGATKATEGMQYNTEKKSYIVVVQVANASDLENAASYSNANAKGDLKFQSFAVYPSTTKALNSKQGKADGLNFTNKYTENTNDEQNGTDLKITKTVTGAQGAHDKSFNFTVEFSVPDGFVLPAKYADSGAYLQALATAYNGTYTAATATAPAKATVTFQLKHGESFTFNKTTTDFDGIIVGTQYKVTEDADSNYETTYKATRQKTVTDKAQSETLYEKKDEGDKNQNDVTNAHKDISLTGLAVNNASFVVMAGAAVAGVVGYGVAKRKLEK